MSNKKLWTNSDNLYYGAERTVESLPPDYYKFVRTNGGYAVQTVTIASDELMYFEDSAINSVIKEFELFWQLYDRFKARGLLHKRGMMLYGPPGTGKTASILLMARKVIELQKGIVVQIDDPSIASACLKTIRSIEPTRPIVAVMEDFDALVSRYKEDAFLSLLDGENQIDRIVYFATTNYLKRLDKRFTDRPSRFDYIKEIGIPSEDNRRQYLLNKDPTIVNVDHWVQLSHTFSLAHLRELIILVQCFDIPLEEAADRIHKMRKGKQFSIESTSEDAA